MVNKVTIFKIELQNGNTYPAFKTFECNKTMPEGRLKSYRSRLSKVLSLRYKKELTASLRYKPRESKYNENEERKQQKP